MKPGSLRPANRASGDSLVPVIDSRLSSGHGLASHARWLLSTQAALTVANRFDRTRLPLPVHARARTAAPSRSALAAEALAVLAWRGLVDRATASPLGRTRACPLAEPSRRQRTGTLKTKTGFGWPPTGTLPRGAFPSSLQRSTLVPSRPEPLLGNGRCAVPDMLPHSARFRLCLLGATQYLQQLRQIPNRLDREYRGWTCGIRWRSVSIRPRPRDPHDRSRFRPHQQLAWTPLQQLQPLTQERVVSTCQPQLTRCRRSEVIVPIVCGLTQTSESRKLGKRGIHSLRTPGDLARDARERGRERSPSDPRRRGTKRFPGAYAGDTRCPPRTEASRPHVSRTGESRATTERATLAGIAGVCTVAATAAWRPAATLRRRSLAIRGEATS